MIWPFSPPRVRQVFNFTVCVTDFFTSLNFKPWSQTLSTVSIKCEGKRKKRQTCALINSKVIEGEIVTKFELENCEEVFWHVFFFEGCERESNSERWKFQLERFFKLLKTSSTLISSFSPFKSSSAFNQSPDCYSHRNSPPEEEAGSIVIWQLLKHISHAVGSMKNPWVTSTHTQISLEGLSITRKALPTLIVKVHWLFLSCSLTARLASCVLHTRSQL